MSSTSFDSFAEIYDQTTGDDGGYTHSNTIDPALLSLIGEVKNKTIYDIACGNGYLSRKMIDQGAKEVWASDISPKLVTLAKDRSKKHKINYFVCDANGFTSIPNDHFDIIFMNMAIHYVENIPLFAKNIYKALKKGGRFVYTTDHPLLTVALIDAGVKKRSKKEMIEKIQSYSKPNEVYTSGCWDPSVELVVYQRPLNYYINAFAKANLFTYGMEEPETFTMMNEVSDPRIARSKIPAFYALGVKK